MPRVNPWVKQVRTQLKLEQGFGWSVSEQSGRIKLTRRDADGRRSSVMLDLPWGVPTPIRDVTAAVATLRERMETRGLTLRAAHELTGGLLEPGELDWPAAADRFMASLAGRRTTTLKDITTRVQRTLAVMDSKPAPRDGRELLQRYTELHLADMEPGGEGRRRNLQDVSRFLNYAVDHCGAPVTWRPPAAEVRRDLVGAGDGRDAKLTPPIKPEQLEALLAALDAAGKHEVRLAVGLVGLYGLRPAELATLRMDGDRLLVGQVKRNAGDMRRSKQQQARSKERRVLPLDLPGMPGLGAQLAAQWASGLVKLPPAITNAAAANDLKEVGGAFRQYLKRFQPWLDLVAANPGLTPYSLRHGFAWRAHKGYARSLSVRDTAALMGHSTDTHNRYYGSWTDEAGLVDAVAGLTASVSEVKLPA